MTHAADLLIEPGRASYAAVGEVQPQVLLFGPLGTFEQDGQTYTRLAFAGPSGDALRLYEGDHLGPVVVGAGGRGAAEAHARLLPLRAGHAHSRRTSGRAKCPASTWPRRPTRRPATPSACAAPPRTRPSSGTVKLNDFNGDRQSDLLVYGQEATYVLLGPVELDGITDARDEADYIIDADVGQPAMRMGDISGDGTDRPGVHPQGRRGGADAVITVILGGLADGLELPGYVDRDWVDQVAAAERPEPRAAVGPPRRRRRSSPTRWTWPCSIGTTTVRPTCWSPSPTARQRYVISGQALWRGEDAAATRPTSARTWRRPIWADTSDRADVAADFVNAEIAATSQPGQNVRSVVAGDVNGDGLDDILFTDPDYVSFTDPVLPHIGRAYLVTGRTALRQHRTWTRSYCRRRHPATSEPDHPGHLVGRRGGGPGRSEPRRLRRLRGQPHRGRPPRRPDPRGRAVDLLRPAGLGRGRARHAIVPRRRRRHHRPPRRAGRAIPERHGLPRRAPGHRRRFQRRRRGRPAGGRARPHAHRGRFQHRAGHRRARHGLRALLHHAARPRRLSQRGELGHPRRVRVRPLRHAPGRAVHRPQRRPPGRHPHRRRRAPTR